MTEIPEDQNPYEAGLGRRDGERLAEDNIINRVSNQFSAELIGPVVPGQVIVDIGVGENTANRDYVRSFPGAWYLAYDTRPEVITHRQASDDAYSHTEHCNIREGLPLPDDSADVVHARYFSAFLAPEARAAAWDELFRVVKPGGQLLLIDYDWTATLQSESNLVRELAGVGIHEISRFDADLGQTLAVDAAVHFRQGMVEMIRRDFPILTDYAEILKLEPVIVQGVGLEADGAAKSAYVEGLFAAIRHEAAHNPKSYRWPDACAAIVTKS